MITSQKPDVIVICFDQDADRDPMAFKTYRDAASAIVIGDNATVDPDFRSATEFYFIGNETIAEDVTNHIQQLADDMVDDDRRDAGYDRAHNADLASCFGRL